MNDWYTVPRWYGGRRFPLHRRMYLEWLWRRHGEAGLDRHAERRLQRLLERFPEVVQALRRLTVETYRTGIQMERFAEVLKGVKR